MNRLDKEIIASLKKELEVDNNLKIFSLAVKEDNVIRSSDNNKIFVRVLLGFKDLEYVDGTDIFINAQREKMDVN